MSEFHDKSRPQISVSMEDVEDAPSPMATALVEIAADLSDCARSCRTGSNDATKDEAFRKLYVDLEHFRGQAAFIQTRPLFIDLILLVDRIESNLRPVEHGWHRRGRKPCSPRSATNCSRSWRGAAWSRWCARTTRAFDPHLQRAIRVEPTSLPSEHNLTQFVRRGYQADGQLLRPEDVVVLRHTPPAPTEQLLL